MKKLFAFLIPFTVLLACENEPVLLEKMDKQDLDISAKSSKTNARVSSQEFTDYSGLVKIKLFYESFGAASHNINKSVHVDADYVLVGGAAWVENTENGAYLTQSRPSFSTNDWYASSKDHKNADSHTLHIVAVGLRLQGVSSSLLRSYMQDFSASSGTIAHPSSTVTLPTGYIMVGGGARINWTGAGNLLVHSYPEGNSWKVKGKDHIDSSPASIDAFVIGIRNNEYIPGFGYLESTLTTSSSYISTGSNTVSTSIPSGFVISCPGGRATFNSAGRLIMGMNMDINSPFNCNATTKDLNIADGGYTYAYAVGLRKRP